jgi:hypothetical protein
MRTARQAAGLNPNGEPLVPFRSSLCMRGESESPHSFRNWGFPDPLPLYEDHISGVKLSQPFSAGIMTPSIIPERVSGSYHLPFHPVFGQQSVVQVRIPSSLQSSEMKCQQDSDAEPMEHLSLGITNGETVQGTAVSNPIVPADSPVEDGLKGGDEPTPPPGNNNVIQDS